MVIGRRSSFEKSSHSRYWPQTLKDSFRISEEWKKIYRICFCGFYHQNINFTFLLRKIKRLNAIFHTTTIPTMAYIHQHHELNIMYKIKILGWAFSYHMIPDILLFNGTNFKRSIPHFKRVKKRSDMIFVFFITKT